MQLFYYVLAVYGVSSWIAFLVYWFDKRAARGNRRRVPERTLHWCGLLAVTSEKCWFSDQFSFFPISFNISLVKLVG